MSISAEVRAELDQTPSWWTRLFHQALSAAGAEVVMGETWEWRTWAGDAYSWDERGFPDCPCRDCRRICS